MSNDPHGSSMVSAPETDFGEFAEGDIVAFRYWKYAGHDFTTDVAEVVSTHPGGAHSPASITVKTETGTVRTLYATGRVNAHYRLHHGDEMGHNAPLRIVRHADTAGSGEVDGGEDIDTGGLR